ncbi:hypothetical protein NDU88_006302 [Pleurodeles waltl]|uniref:Uncharacterized protein n=1 Tax=Pleurodeles waltl TaxID=8319 RepID=A0AAV7SPD2_PLEWA|nr:hypothetical protein NDU88_006302 [Pleurodeles waltl]
MQTCALGRAPVHVAGSHVAAGSTPYTAVDTVRMRQTHLLKNDSFTTKGNAPAQTIEYESTVESLAGAKPGICVRCMFSWPSLYEEKRLADKIRAAPSCKPAVLFGEGKTCVSSSAERQRKRSTRKGMQEPFKRPCFSTKSARSHCPPRA